MSSIASRIRRQLIESATKSSANSGNLREAGWWKLDRKAGKAGSLAPDIIYIIPSQFSKLPANERAEAEAIIRAGYIGPYRVERIKSARGKVVYKVISREPQGAAEVEAQVKDNMAAAAAKKVRDANKARSSAMSEYQAEQKLVNSDAEHMYLDFITRGVDTLTTDLNKKVITIDNPFSGAKILGKVGVEGSKIMLTLGDINIDSDNNNLILRSFTARDQYGRDWYINPENAATIAASSESDYDLRQKLYSIGVLDQLAQDMRKSVDIWSGWRISRSPEKNAALEQAKSKLMSLPAHLEKTVDQLAGKNRELEMRYHAAAIKLVAKSNDVDRKEQTEELAQQHGLEFGTGKFAKETSKRGFFSIYNTTITKNEETIHSGMIQGFKTALLEPLVDIGPFAMDTPDGFATFRFKREGDMIKMQKLVGTRVEQRVSGATDIDEPTGGVETEIWKDTDPTPLADWKTRISDLRGFMELFSTFAATKGGKTPADLEHIVGKSGYANLSFEDADIPEEFLEKWMSAFTNMREGRMRDYIVAGATNANVTDAVRDMGDAAAKEATDIVEATLKDDASQKKMMADAIMGAAPIEQVDELAEALLRAKKEADDAGINIFSQMNEDSLSHLHRFTTYVKAAGELAEDTAEEMRTRTFTANPEDVNAATDEESDMRTRTVTFSDELRYEYARIAEKLEDIAKSIAAERAEYAKRISGGLQDFERTHFGGVLQPGGSMDDASYKDSKSKEMHRSTIGRFYDFVDRHVQTEQDALNSVVDKFIFNEAPLEGESTQKPSWFRAHLNNIGSAITKRWNIIMNAIKNLNSRFSANMARGMKGAATAIAGDVFLAGLTRIATEIGSTWADVITAVKHPSWILSVAGSAAGAAAKSASVYFAAEFAENFVKSLFSSNSTIMRSIASAVSKLTTALFIERAWAGVIGGAAEEETPQSFGQEFSAGVGAAVSSTLNSYVESLTRTVPGAELIFNTMSGNEDQADLITNLARNHSKSEVAVGARDARYLMDALENEFEFGFGEHADQLGKPFDYDDATWTVKAHPIGVTKLRLIINARAKNGGSHWLRVARGNKVTEGSVRSYLIRHSEVLPRTIKRKDGGEAPLGLYFSEALASAETKIYPGTTQVEVVVPIRGKNVKAKGRLIAAETIETVDKFFQGTLFEKGSASAARKAAAERKQQAAATP